MMDSQDLSNDFSDESDYEESPRDHQTFIYNSSDGSLLPKKIKLENPINKKCSVTLEKIRKCDKCDKYFVTSNQYLEHRKIHQQIRKNVTEKKDIEIIDLDETFRCDFCKEEFPEIKVLRDHIKEIHMKPFYHNHDITKFYSREITKETLVKCDICDKEFQDQIYLDDHSKDCKTSEEPSPEALEDIPVTETPIDEPMAVVEKLVPRIEKQIPFLEEEIPPFERQIPVIENQIPENVRNVLKDKKSGILEEFKCKKCGKNFPRKEELKSHVKTDHQKPKIPCDRCKLTFLNEQGLFAHKNTDHKKFQCEKCDKEFHMLFNLKKHAISCSSKSITNPLDESEDIFTNHQRFHCDICGKKYSTMSLVKEHVTSFHDDLRFQCDKCKEYFTESQDLKEHERNSHQMNRIFKCLPCGQKFKSQDESKDHIEVCKAKPKDSKEKEQKDLKEKVKPKAEKLSCKKCNKKFLNYIYLDLHAKSCKDKIEKPMPKPSKILKDIKNCQLKIKREKSFKKRSTKGIKL